MVCGYSYKENLLQKTQVLHSYKRRDIMLKNSANTDLVILPQTHAQISYTGFTMADWRHQSKDLFPDNSKVLKLSNTTLKENKWTTLLAQTAMDQVYVLRESGDSIGSIVAFIHVRKKISNLCRFLNIFREDW